MATGGRYCCCINGVDCDKCLFLYFGYTAYQCLLASGFGFASLVCVSSMDFTAGILNPKEKDYDGSFEVWTVLAVSMKNKCSEHRFCFWYKFLFSVHFNEFSTAKLHEIWRFSNTQSLNVKRVYGWIPLMANETFLTNTTFHMSQQFNIFDKKIL